MVLNNVIWQKSKTSQLMGVLAVDGGNLSFSKNDQADSYVSGYTIGNTTYVRKEEVFGNKLNKLLGGMFKKAANVREDFALAKADISGVTSMVMEAPKFDPQKGQIVKGESIYIAQVDFMAGGEKYTLTRNCDTESEAKEFEGYFK